MKRCLLFSIPLALLCVLNAWTAPVEPVRTLILNGTSNPPVMDGVAENVYSDIQHTTIFNPTGYDGESDFTASFQLAYDMSYLYILVEITDDVEHNYVDGVGNPWEFDNFELFLQLDTNTVTTSYSNTTIQLRFCRGEEFIQTPGRADPMDYGSYVESDATGWIAEVAVPWTAALPEGSIEEDIMDYLPEWPIGFDFSGADSDNSDGDADVGNRDVQSAWDMDDPDDAEDRTEDLAWNNTSVFGYIELYFEDINQYAIDHNLNLFPNPAENAISIANLQKPGQVRIYNMQGMRVLEKMVYPEQALDISALKSGMYSLVIDGEESGRFIKN